MTERSLYIKQMRFLLLLITLLIYGCSRTIECDDPNILLSFIGFARADLNKITIRRFEKNTGFQTLLDSTAVDSSKIKYEIYADTTDVYFNYGSNFSGFQPGYDWEIYLPVKNQTLRLSEISAEKRTGKCPLNTDICRCNNQLFSFKVDNQVRNAQLSLHKNYNDWYSIYLR